MQGVHAILIFASLGLTLGLTLLLGAQWGVVMGVLAYLAGSNVLLNQEVKKLKAYIDRVINELPEALLQQMSRNAKAPSTPTASTQPTVEAKSQAVDAIEQRMSALDHKLELLLQHMQGPTVSPQPASRPPPAVRPAPATHPLQEAAPPATPPIQATPSATPVVQPMPSAAAPTPTPATAAAPSAPELELMREFLLKMAQTMLSSKAEGATETRHDAPPQAMAPSSAAPGKTEASHKPSIDELRSELDKITRELSLELGRKP